MISSFRHFWTRFRIRNILIGIVIFYLLLGIVGFFVLPPFLKSFMLERISAELGRPVTIDAISINPYALSAEIGPLRIGEKNEQATFVAFDKLYLNAELDSLFKGGPVLSEIRLEKPVLHIVRKADGTYNFSDLIEKYAGKPEADKKTGTETRTAFSLNNIRILNGSIDFIDGPRKTTHTIRELTLQVPFVSTLPHYTETFVEPLLDAVVNDTRLVFTGRTKPFADSLETQIDVRLKGFNVPAYLAYLPFKPPFLLSKGSIDADTQLSYIQYRDRSPSLGLKGTIDVRDVVLDDLSKKPLLRVPHFGMAIATSDIMAQQFHFSKMTVEGIEVYAARGRDGTWAIPALPGDPAASAGRTAPKNRQETEAAAAKPAVLVDELDLQKGKVVYNDFLKSGMLAATCDAVRLTLRQISVNGAKREVVLGEVRAAGGNLALRHAPDTEAGGQQTALDSPAVEPGVKASGEKPWIVTLSSVGIDQYAVTVEDTVPSDPVRLNLEGIRFSGKNLSTGKNIQGSASLQSTINKRGMLNVEGPLSLEPLTAKFKVNLQGLDLAPFRSYAADRYKVAVTGGRVGANGVLTIAAPKEGMNVRYQGRATVAKFSSIDKANAEDFVRFDALTFNAMDISMKPLRVLIREIALTDFYSRIIINEDGSLNTQGLSEQPSGPAASAPSDEQKPDQQAASPDEQKQDRLAELQSMRTQKLVKIDTVTAQGGTIHFTDRHIKPGFTAKLQEIGGRVSGLTSEEEQFADVELRGVLDGNAPLEITGKINPLRENLYVNLKADFKNMDLSPTSPYAGRYLGYTIQKGKLALGMQYLIVNKKLEAQNNVFIDQLSLGEEVESPEATKMPVKLAISLLKNRKGEIQLDLPIEGTTDDPDFRVGKIIWKVILNLLVKAATSPFALLGAIFGGGGGEEMSYVDFEYGLATISAQEQQKIDKVLTVLYERPALKVEIEGHADLANDREGLKQEYLRRKVKAQKLKDLSSDDETIDPATVVVGKEEYPKYLKRAYKAEKFPKPSNFLGIAKDIPVPEMEKLMVTHAQITDAMLRELAVERAQAVYRYMTKAKKIEPERIFLIEPKSVAPEKKQKVRDSRVDFKLQ